MYCSNCGNEVKAGLNYCNKCGGKVQESGEAGTTSVSKNLAIALAYIGPFGFAAIVGLVALLLEYDMREGLLFVLVAMFLATLFGICYLILGEISKLSKKPAESDQSVSRFPVTNELNSPNTNQLEEPKEAPASVVENTTRTLDKVAVERK